MIFERIMEMLQWITDALRRSRPTRWRQEDLYSGAADKDEELTRVRELGGKRVRTVYVIGSEASMDGVSHDTEVIDYWSDEHVQTKVNYHEIRRCDCGALMAGDNLALGTCSVCLSVICHAEGCSARCERCGDLVCKRHSIRLKEHTFCSHHRMSGYWLAFWGLLK